MRARAGRVRCSAIRPPAHVPDGAPSAARASSRVLVESISSTISSVTAGSTVARRRAIDCRIEELDGFGEAIALARDAEELHAQARARA